MNRTDLIHISIGSAVLIAAGVLGPKLATNAADLGLTAPQPPAARSIDDGGLTIRTAPGNGQTFVAELEIHRTAPFITGPDTDEAAGPPLLYSIAHFAGGLVPDRSAARLLGTDMPWIDPLPRGRTGSRPSATNALPGPVNFRWQSRAG